MAGLSLITSHTKAYAEQNCGSKGGGVTVIQHSGEPIVCVGGGKRILNSSGSGRDIEIDMDKGPGEAAAVTVKDGADITIVKRLKVIKGRSGLPVIKVLSGGALTLVEEVNVTGATEMQKAIVVEGGNSSVMLNGKLTGFEGGEVKVSNEGTVVFEKGVKGIEGMKVGINNGGGTVRFDGSVTFNNDEAGIKITGDRAGKATVMGMGGTGEMVTMTVNGSGGDGVGIQMDGTGGT
ncbi:hypothetical protein, partial [Bartonella bovis]|uniref:hypothetical protein n=1 Tax=Bartonella bovis TaxID=155194 RepID=UPI00195BA176